MKILKDMFLAVVFSVAMLASCKLTDWVDENKPDIPDFPTTTIPASAESEHGFSHPATVAAKITMTGLNRKGVYLSQDKRSWKIIDECDGEIWCFVKRGGKWIGAKYDHIRPTDTMREHKHMYPRPDANDPDKTVPAYGKWVSIGGPVAGEEVAFVVMKYGIQERSNAVFGVMP
jgi:hypothetical protein